MTTHPTDHGARYDGSVPAIRITDMLLTHPAVTTEALRWSSGSRGAAVAAAEMDGADVTAYVEQAVIVGAQAIAAAGSTQDTFNLEQLVQDVGVRTAQSTAQAAESTGKVVSEATKAVTDASAEARKAIAEAGDAGRKAFAEAVARAEQNLRQQVGQLLGGEDPELLARLKPVLEQFGAALTHRADAHTADLFERATRALDADDPTSPMAKHLKALDARQEELTKRWDANHRELSEKVAELTTAVQVQASAAKAAKETAGVTTLKGAAYEDLIHESMRTLATGLGDEYRETGTTAGAISRCKKGDGLLLVSGDSARVVLEMTDSDRQDWNDYLDQAERNRQATASLGLVPSSALNKGEVLRVLAPRRVVMAFDPEVDDASILRSVIQVLRMTAIATAARRGDVDVDGAMDRLSDALDALPTIDGIRKRAGAIRGHADHIDRDADKLQTTLNRILLQARTALAGAGLTAVAGSAQPEATDEGQGAA